MYLMMAIVQKKLSELDYQSNHLNQIDLNQYKTIHENTIKLLKVENKLGKVK